MAVMASASGPLHVAASGSPAAPASSAARILVAALADDADGGHLVGLLGIRLVAG